MSESSLLRQLLDRQEITAVMAAYTRWADMNQPEQQAEVFIEDCRVKYHLTDWIATPRPVTTWATSRSTSMVRTQPPPKVRSSPGTAATTGQNGRSTGATSIAGRGPARAGGSPNANFGRQAPSAATTASYHRSAAHPAP